MPVDTETQESPAEITTSVRVVYAFLATAAEISSEGKLSVLGGDFDQIRVPALPAAMPLLALVLKLAAPLEELGKHVRLVLRVLAPDGSAQVEATRLVAVGSQAHGPHREARMGLLFNFAPVRFSVEGDFRVQVLVEDRELTSLPLRVVRAEEAEG